jgi:hypothetical protein
MLLQAYLPHEIRFAYCYHLYLRFRTHACRPHQPLASLDRAELDGLVRPLW